MTANEAPGRKGRRATMLATAGLAVLVLAGCTANTPKHMRPIPYATIAAMEKKGLTKEDPILLRIFKQESELEVWKKSSKDGKFRKFKTYDICKWSGELGPKKKEGDRQAPEGFYHVTPALMNPNSSYHLSFNIGFPNAFDRSHERTGTHLMVHGSCSSAGCYAMEDEQIEEIYSLAREAFDAGQKSFQVQAFPFRMTPENLALNAGNEHIDFWRMLKEGNDHFEVTGRQPDVQVCERRYVFNAMTGEFDPTGPCPEIEIPDFIQLALAEKQAADAAEEQIVLARLEKKRAKEAEATMIASAEPAADDSTARRSIIPTAFTGGGLPGSGLIGRFRRPAPPVSLEPDAAPVEEADPAAAPVPDSRPDVAANAEEAMAIAVVNRRWAPSLPVLGYLPERWR